MTNKLTYEQIKILQKLRNRVKFWNLVEFYSAISAIFCLFSDQSMCPITIIILIFGWIQAGNASQKRSKEVNLIKKLRKSA